MKTVFCGLTALLFSINSLAQTSVPVFRSKADSVLFEKLISEIQEAFEQKEFKKFDRLRMEQMTLLQTKLVRYITIYASDPNFVTLKTMTSQPLDSIRKLSIGKVKGRHLPDSVYLCKNLEVLELVNCKLQKVPRKLNSLPKLKKLVILENKPKSNMRLSRLKYIETLSIRSNDGDKLPRSFGKLKKIHTIDLARNSLTKVPSFRGCKTLRKVDLSNNLLTLADLSTHQPRTLETLVLNGNKIKVVPASIGSFTGLTRLHLINNQIEAIHTDVSKLSQLTDLALYHNNLPEIPVGLYSLTQLRIIDLYFNHIKNVAPDIKNWSKLEVLYLANNEIFSVPSELGQLTHLKELYLHHNKLSNLPESIKALEDLSVLRINHNNLLELPQAVYGFKKLQNLDFSENQIQTFSIPMFSFNDLKILSIVGNPWDEKTKLELEPFVEKLRAKQVVVHVTTYED